MKCPCCEHQDPQVTVLKDEQVTIAGKGRISNLSQKADVSVECGHCHAHFLLEFQVTPTGPMIDLS